MAGATINFGNGTHTLDASSSVSGDGNVSFTNDVTVTLEGTYDITGITSINNNAVVNFNSVTTSVTAGLNLWNGTLGGTGTVDISDSLHWSGGQMGGSGVTNLYDTTNTAVVGGYWKDLNTRTLNNAGTVVWTASGTYRQIRGSNGAVFNNLGTGVFDAQSDAEFTHSAGTQPSFNNDGSVTRTVSAGVFEIHLAVNNTNVIDIQTGTLAFTAEFTHAVGATIQGTGILDISSATYSSLSGEFEPAVAGTADTLAISGPLVLDGGSYLNIDIGGTTSGDYDVITVSGDVTIDGTININPIGGYVPNSGDLVTILTWTGAVIADNGITAPAGWIAIVGASSIQLEYTGP